LKPSWVEDDFVLVGICMDLIMSCFRSDSFVELSYWALASHQLVNLRYYLRNQLMAVIFH
jgi:hypothetical protein